MNEEAKHQLRALLEAMNRSAQNPPVLSDGEQFTPEEHAYMLLGALNLSHNMEGLTTAEYVAWLARVSKLIQRGTASGDGAPE